MRRLLLSLGLLIAALAAPAGAGASWHAPITVSSGNGDTTLQGLAAGGDRPTLLLDHAQSGRHLLQLRATDTHGRLGTPQTVTISHNGFFDGALAAGKNGDLIAGWLEIINGSRRPVVATGTHLQNRQVLAPGPRSTQILRLAANRRGDAVVTFWRYKGSGYQVFAALRPAGGRFGTPQVVADGKPGFPVVAIDEQGNAAVATEGTRTIQVAVHRAGSDGFAPTVIVPGSAGATSGPGLAVTDGRVDLAWVAPTTDGRRAVMAAQRAATATAFSPTLQLSPLDLTIPHNVTPAVVGDGQDTLISWVQGVPHTQAHNVAALAIGRGDTWTRAVTRAAPAAYHVSDTPLLAPLGTRPALLALTEQHLGVRRLQTATVRADHTLVASRDVPLGGQLGAAPVLAQGSRHTWLAANIWNVRAQRNRVILLSSS
jgi:hypothetical protein